MDNFWNERYAADEYVYGKQANTFIKKSIDSLKPGKLLLPGEGEGRNAVYAASQGWEVFAFDQSEVGKKKALQLAREQGVQIQYEVSSLLNYPLEKSSFDLIGLCYFHLLPEARKLYHAMLVQSLRPGAQIALEVFSKEQLGNESGGPRDLKLLYALEDIKNDFADLETIYAEREDIMLNEGPFHQGKANVVRYIGEKIC